MECLCEKVRLLKEKGDVKEAKKVASNVLMIEREDWGKRVTDCLL